MARKTIEQHQTDIKHWGPRGIRMLQSTMEKVGEEVLAYARREKLHGPAMPRGVSGGLKGSTLATRSGGLRRSLTKKSSVRGTEVKVEVGTNLTNKGHPYPRYHEYSSPGGMIPERPWLRPSVMAKQERLREEIKKTWVAAYGK